MHHAASSRAFVLFAALASFAAFGCDSSEDPEEPGPSGPTGGTGSGGAPGGGTLIAHCETASANDPNVHDGYHIDAVNGWELAWFTYTDAVDAMTAGMGVGTITPMEKAPFVCVSDMRNGAASWVFNAKGGGFQAWGAGMGFNMKIMAEPTPPGNVDLSRFTGVRFWAKVNSATTGAVRLKLVDQQTTPIARGGTCTTMNGKCDNNFGVPLTTISLEWQQFTVPFAMFKQESWSSEMFAAPQTTNVIGFQFQVGKTEFDYSVDDFELY